MAKSNPAPCLDLQECASEAARLLATLCKGYPDIALDTRVAQTREKLARALRNHRTRGLVG